MFTKRKRKVPIHLNADNKKFIFETGSYNRWGVFTLFSTLLMIFICMLIFFAVLGIYLNPIMKELESKGSSTFADITPSGIDNSVRSPLSDTGSNEKYLNQAIPVDHDVYAFYVNWDINSKQSLIKNIDSIDVLIPQWFHLNSDLELESNIQTEIGDLAKKNNVKVTPLINNESNGEWDQEAIHRLLNSPEDQNKLINNLHSQIKKHGYDGINIDFENIKSSDRDLLSKFMERLYKVFHSDGLSVSIDVPPANQSFDYRELEKHADRIILMAYDENVLNPGPVASSNWFKESLSSMSKKKLIAGLGSYGYDWDWESREGGEPVSFDDVTRLAEKADLKIQWDDMSKTPFLKYMKNNRLHEIWLLDSATFYNQLKMSAEAGVQGVALWRLGTEDPSIWDVLNGSKAEQLLTVKNGGNIYSTGEGNIFRAKENREEGRRELHFDDSGFINFEDYITNPRSSEFERLSKPSGKEVVLTFDDGPDPEYTEDILKILKEHQVKATFFLIGKKAMFNQDIVEKIHMGGHEIGNHTFSHPKANTISPGQLKYELNSTQRIIQGITGRTTLLYRSPYGDEEAKYLQSHFEKMQETTRQGYITVNYDIDSKDWKLRSSKAIVENVLNQVKDGDIILMHDGGGDRDATVESLPEIIKQLKSKGYTFTTVSDLMGESESTVMPAVDKAENPIMHSANIALFTISNFKYFISFLLYSAMAILVLRLLIFGYLAYRHKKQIKSIPEAVPSYTPAVSVIIAAYNEEKVICRTVKSILNSKYSNIEVIVVNDGSKDKTALMVSGNFCDNERVHLLNKVNGGKASAINMGIRKAKGEIVIAIDADTLISPEAISNFVSHFEDEKVAAVSGNVRVGNKRNMLTLWQHIEYVTGFNLEKRTFDKLNCVTVVPGAIGAWRKKNIEDLGYFTSDTLAEDTDMTLNLQRQGHKVIVDEHALGYTEAPEKVKDFLKQRFRWTFGTLQCFWKHKKSLGSKNRSLGLVAFPNMLVFQFIVPLCAPFLDILILLGILAGEWKKSLLVFSCYFITDFLASLFAFKLEKLSIKPLFILLPQRIIYRYLLLYVSWKSLLTAIKGNRVGWNKLDREGNIKLDKAG